MDRPDQLARKHATEKDSSATRKRPLASGMLFSVAVDATAQLLHRRPACLALEAALHGAFGRPGLLARRRWRLGRLGDQRGQARPRVGAVLLLGTEAAGLDDDDAVLGGALA